MTNYSSKLQISDLEIFTSDIEQELTFKESEQIMGGLKEEPEPEPEHGSGCYCSGCRGKRVSKGFSLNPPKPS